MAGLTASVASTGRQTGTTLGVAIAGTIVGSGTVLPDAARAVWWLVLALGAGVLGP
jgi:hypothetical protein